MLIAQEQLGKSAGKPRCKDGAESASVNPLTPGAPSSMTSPSTASTKGGASRSCEQKLSISSCEMEGSNMVTYRSYCTNWYFILFQGQ